VNRLGVLWFEDPGPSFFCGELAALEIASFSRATSFSRAAWLNAGLNVTRPGLPREDPDLLNRSAGSTFLSKINFFTLCLSPLPSREPGFPFANDSESRPAPFCPPSVEDEAVALNPRSFELAGVYPNWIRGTGDRVGMSTKNPGFFFGCESMATARGPGGSIENIGKSPAMGSAIDAVSVPCALGADVEVAKVLPFPNNEVPKEPVDVEVLMAGAAGFGWPNSEPPNVLVPVDGWFIVLCPRGMLVDCVPVVVPGWPKLVPPPNKPVPVVGLAAPNRPPVCAGCCA